MSSSWESWWYGGDSYDRENARRIDDLAATQAAARSRLASQMEAQQGSLQGQIDRLTQAFVAMVEYEDIRGELNEHADAAAWRKFAREIVPNLVVTGGSGLDAIPLPPEVPGYWLSWAARGLVATASGGDGSAQLDRAHQLDPQRAALLVVLIDAMRNEVRFSGDHLATTLPSAGDPSTSPATGEVTLAQRALWLAIARGSLGPGAASLLEDRLREALGSPDAGVLEKWVRGLGSSARDIAESTNATRTLEALGARVDPPSSSSGDGGDTTAELDAAFGSPEDPLAELVRSLVDEGAPGEDAILDRMADVRSRMGFVEKRVTDHRWSSPGGSVLELLLEDLGAPDSAATRGPRRLAVRLLGPALTPVVDRLEAQASIAPGPQDVSALGSRVVVGPDGPLDPHWLTGVEEKIRLDSVISPVRGYAGYALLGVGGVALLLALLAAVWLVLALLALAAGAAILISERTRLKATGAERTRRLARAREDLDHAVARQVEAAQTHRGDVASATETAARLRARLSGSAVAEG